MEESVLGGLSGNKPQSKIGSCGAASSVVFLTGLICASKGIKERGMSDRNSS